LFKFDRCGFGYFALSWCIIGIIFLAGGRYKLIFFKIVKGIFSFIKNTILFIIWSMLFIVLFFLLMLPAQIVVIALLFLMYFVIGVILKNPFITEHFNLLFGCLEIIITIPVLIITIRMFRNQLKGNGGIKKSAKRCNRHHRASGHSSRGSKYYSAGHGHHSYSSGYDSDYDYDKSEGSYDSDYDYDSSEGGYDSGYGSYSGGSSYNSGYSFSSSSYDSGSGSSSSSSDD
jgi:hypothetical protein